jgi:hypothetical protein
MTDTGKLLDCMVWHCKLQNINIKKPKNADQK